MAGNDKVAQVLLEEGAEERDTKSRKKKKAKKGKGKNRH
jgi:hypothetical protein